jgi:TPR repeat protein
LDFEMRGCEFAVGGDSSVATPFSWTAVASTSALVVSIFFGGASVSLALDGSNPPNPPEKLSPETFTSTQEALRAGVDDLQNGDAQSSLRALTYAADGGEPLARWKLGNLYATGVVVPRNDALAYKYFEQLVESYNEDDFNRRDLGAVSNAFVSIGLYSLTGIANTDVRPDPERALEMFQIAATDFGDPEAQYRLARMYLEGSAGLIKDNMLAARWLALAAEKSHHGAQALLGDLLFRGDGVPRQRARGLMWLMIAASGAKGASEGWIHEVQGKDFAAASDDDREVAKAYFNAYGKLGDLSRAGAPRPVKPPMRLPGSVSPGATMISAPPPGQ